MTVGSADLTGESLLCSKNCHKIKMPHQWSVSWWCVSWQWSKWTKNWHFI